MTAYLDHAADTPMRPAAVRALADASALPGNPASVHADGRRARRVVEDARERLAAALHARPAEVVWTSGGTESDNLAVRGLYRASVAGEPTRRAVLVGAVEHAAVLAAAHGLEPAGARVVEIGVHRDGTVDLAELAWRLAGGDVALVAVQWANNEIGTLQPVDEVAGLCAASDVPLHVDAVAAVGQVPVRFAHRGTLAMSGHKLGGPAGVGALLVRRDLDLVADQVGGSQEHGLRAGSVPTALVAACAAAVDVAVASLDAEAARLCRLRDALAAGLLDAVPDVRLQGPSDPARRLPGLVHVTLDGARGEDLLYLLDSAGISASTGAACHAGVARPSHVLAAVGVDEDTCAALRLSLGHTSTVGDVDAVLAEIDPAVTRARAAWSPALHPVAR